VGPIGRVYQGYLGNILGVSYSLFFSVELSGVILDEWIGSFCLLFLLLHFLHSSNNYNQEARKLRYHTCTSRNEGMLL
jgi:hypothetical protein